MLAKPGKGFARWAGWGRQHTYLLVAVVVNLHGFQIHGVLLEGSQRINAAAHNARNVGGALLVWEEGGAHAHSSAPHLAFVRASSHSAGGKRHLGRLRLPATHCPGLNEPAFSALHFAMHL